MKRLKILLLIPLLLAAFNSHGQFVKAELQVNGLTCSMCSKSVDKALHTIAFIESIEVDLEHTSYLIKFKPNSHVDPDLIAKKVKDAGFTVGKLVMWFNFDKVQVSKDVHWSWQNLNFMFMNAENRVLSGLQPLTFVDYAFISKKEFLQKLGNTSFACYKTGYSESCCPATVAPKTRIYHVVL